MANSHLRPENPRALPGTAHASTEVTTATSRGKDCSIAASGLEISRDPVVRPSQPLNRDSAHQRQANLGRALEGWDISGGRWTPFEARFLEHTRCASHAPHPSDYEDSLYVSPSKQLLRFPCLLLRATP